jgi:DNA ligase-1
VARRQGHNIPWACRPQPLGSSEIYYSNFALWDENENDERELVTFAKAFSGLTDAEFREVDAWIKRNTLERFGPVRSVTPELVFEIAFEGIALSKRHKSGVATRFPRILRWRKDKKITEANTLEDLKKMIP